MPHQFSTSTSEEGTAGLDSESRADPSWEERYEAWAADALARWLPRDAPQFPAALSWVTSRYREGRTMADLVRPHLSSPGRVLDLGSGNGGVSLGAWGAGLPVIACDVTLSGEVLQLRSELDARFPYAVGRGEQLPFARGSFDAVLLLDTIEHVSLRQALGAEVARVVKPGGVVVVTTPPRCRFLFRGDPHFGIPGLAWLPAPAQKLVAERIAKRTGDYDVRHLFWTARGVARAFPRGAFAWSHRGQGALSRLGLAWDYLLGVRQDS